ncbi:hypothetical protein [Bdellovibrio sp. BCCA]|uniref:hypothetical protein n=1 Tax=Bdellovibrio sp. BCCA TaxID=3136281 RepID=UPI0030F2CB5B
MEKPQFKFDENLRSIPVDPEYLKSYVKNMESSLDSITSPKEYVSVIGEIAVYLRVLGDFQKAEEALTIRKTMNAPQDQIESTELAIQRTKQLLKT